MCCSQRCLHVLAILNEVRLTWSLKFLQACTRQPRVLKQTSKLGSLQILCHSSDYGNCHTCRDLQQPPSIHRWEFCLPEAWGMRKESTWRRPSIVKSLHPLHHLQYDIRHLAHGLRHLQRVYYVECVGNLPAAIKRWWPFTVHAIIIFQNSSRISWQYSTECCSLKSVWRDLRQVRCMKAIQVWLCVSCKVPFCVWSTQLWTISLCPSQLKILTRSHLTIMLNKLLCLSGVVKVRRGVVAQYISGTENIHDLERAFLRFAQAVSARYAWPVPSQAFALQYNWTVLYFTKFWTAIEVAMHMLFKPRLCMKHTQKNHYDSDGNPVCLSWSSCNINFQYVTNTTILNNKRQEMPMSSWAKS